MFRSFGLRSIRYRGLFVGVIVLLSVTASALPRAPSSIIDGPTPITDPVDSFNLLLQTGPIEVPIPTSDPFVS